MLMTLDDLQSIATTRFSRLRAIRAWDSASGLALARAQAETLISVLSTIRDPTLRDLLQYIGPDTYDLESELRVEVHAGDCIGRHGLGPTISNIVTVLRGLSPDEIDIVLDRQLSHLVSDTVAAIRPKPRP